MMRLGIRCTSHVSPDPVRSRRGHGQLLPFREQIIYSLLVRAVLATFRWLHSSPAHQAVLTRAASTRTERHGCGTTTAPTATAATLARSARPSSSASRGRHPAARPWRYQVSAALSTTAAASPRRHRRQLQRPRQRPRNQQQVSEVTCPSSHFWCRKTSNL